MKKALALLLVLAAVVAPAALAEKGPKPGKGPNKGATGAAGPTCKPSYAVILKGTFVAAGADGSSFTMDVKKANAHGKKLAGKKGVSVLADSKTRFTRRAEAKLADLKAGDRLVVHGRLCKGADVEQAQLVARKVTAQPAAAPAAAETAPAAAATAPAAPSS